MRTKERESLERVVINNMRYYKVTQFADDEDKTGKVVGIFPSVTSVLGATEDKSFLKRWEKRIGKENAQYITESAGRRGTVMHRLCEIYLGLPSMMNPKDRLEETLRMSVTDKEINEFDNRAKIVGGMLFYNYIRCNTFSIIKETRLTERFLWSIRGGGYAGTVDNVSELWDMTDAVIDFKTSLKAKDPNGIENYKCQVAAYAVAVYDRLGIKCRSAHIMISNEADLEPQTITLDSTELKKYYNKFLERLTEFYTKFPPVQLEPESDDLF
jgi:hypothetical protein